MTNDATVVTAIAGAIVAVIGALVGPKTIEAITKLRKQSHEQWRERRKLEIAEKAEEREAKERQQSEEWSREEQANTAAYKGLIARLDSEVGELKTRLDKAQREAHECDAKCARLEVINERLKQEVSELQDRVLRLEGRV